ncbi:MAG: hypothetical protein KBT00_01900 [Bacteroidales bacterium]|nr:hypothetical protein [Candidatus Cacconaster merdequi]
MKSDMKKAILISLVALFATSSLFAQEGKKSSPEKLNFITIQAGMNALVGENTRAFMYAEKDNHIGEIFTAQGSVSLGFKFTPMVGGRIAAGVSKNNSAGAWRTVHKIQRYSFTSVRAFADIVFDPNGKKKNTIFTPLLYAGLGVAHSTGFQMKEIDFEKTHFLSTPTTSFGMRIGFLGLYHFTDAFGLFFDLGLEAYSDSYDAQDSRWDPETKRKGYNPANTPLDLLPNTSFGIQVNF